MSEDFRDILLALKQEGARFLVVGAHALAAHGVPRVTGDLDVWAERSPENAQHIVAALTRFGVPLEAWADRLTGSLFGVDVSFLGRASFIINKRASGREKDLRDIEMLEGGV